MTRKKQSSRHTWVSNQILSRVEGGGESGTKALSSLGSISFKGWTSTTSSPLESFSWGMAGICGVTDTSSLIAIFESSAGPY